MKTLNFTDRLTYLAWRKEWKAAYAQVSVDIRTKRNEFKACQRKIVFVRVDAGKTWAYDKPTYDGKSLYSSGYIVACRAWQQAQREANRLLSLLSQAKEKSGEQRAAMVLAMTPESA